MTPTTLVALDCPINPVISPYIDDVQGWVAGWTRRHGLAGPVADRLAEIGVGRYAARIYPDATPADLRVVAALFTWFFLADDECDRSLPAPGRVQEMVIHVLDTLETGAQALDGPLGAMLADAWQVPYRRMPAHWRARFVGTVEHHLRGVVVEARNKATGHRPGVAEYVELRRATSAAYVSHALVDFAAGVSVPEAAWRHPAVRAYSAAGNDLLSWFNDLLNVDQDAATSGGHNLVLAVAAELSLSVAEATDRVREHWQERVRALPRLRAALPALGPAAERYLDGVDHALRATVDWCLESPRYR